MPSDTNLVRIWTALRYTVPLLSSPNRGPRPRFAFNLIFVSSMITHMLSIILVLISYYHQSCIVTTTPLALPPIPILERVSTNFRFSAALFPLTPMFPLDTNNSPKLFISHTYEKHRGPPTPCASTVSRNPVLPPLRCHNETIYLPATLLGNRAPERLGSPSPWRNVTSSTCPSGASWHTLTKRRCAPPPEEAGLRSYLAKEVEACNWN